MPIYAIYLEHPDSGDWDSSDSWLETIGYVTSEEAAIKYCDAENNIKAYKDRELEIADYHKRREAWQFENNNRYIMIGRLQGLIDHKAKLLKDIKILQDLSKVPVERRGIIEDNVNKHNASIRKIIADIDKKIQASVDIETAERTNRAIDDEKAAFLGKCPEHIPCNTYSYKLLTNLE